MVRDPFGEHLEDLMAELDLTDVLLKNAKYTWSNKRCGASYIAARLNRFLVSSPFFNLDYIFNSFTLPCASSDHKPIALSLSPPKNLSPIPFRFNPLWINSPDFLVIVKQAWSTNFFGPPSFIWESKLKCVKKNLKDWAKKSFKSPFNSKLALQNDLRNLQDIMEKEDITPALIDKEKNLELKILKVARQEEETWRLKSRQLWLKGGDSNTNYFHNQSKARRSRNAIRELKNGNGIWIRGQENLSNLARNHFHEIFTDEGEADLTAQADLLAGIPNMVPEDINQDLIKPIHEQEIKEAVWNLQIDKAPGPDGFTSNFYRATWSIIKDDLKCMLNWTRKKYKIGGATNSSFLALIPKDKAPNSLSCFRPISLCNTSYKILSKILATRMKKVMGKIISETQGGFLVGHQILDNIFLVQESIHSSISKNHQGMAIKLDMANAFDRVNHDFLYAIMIKFGFSERFVRWVKACTNTPWIAPLVNGRPTTFFLATRGLRQGFPLSPFLYLLVVDSLSRKLHNLQSSRDLKGIKIARGIRPINHSQFADDTILLGRASTLIATQFKKALDTFLKASNGKVNMRKSRIYSWNCPNRTLLRIARILGFEGVKDWNSFSYMGVPILRGKKKVAG